MRIRLKFPSWAKKTLSGENTPAVGNSLEFLHLIRHAQLAVRPVLLQSLDQPAGIGFAVDGDLPAMNELKLLHGSIMGSVQNWLEGDQKVAHLKQIYLLPRHCIADCNRRIGLIAAEVLSYLHGFAADIGRAQGPGVPDLCLERLFGHNYSSFAVFSSGSTKSILDRSAMTEPSGRFSANSLKLPPNDLILALRSVRS